MTNQSPIFNDQFERAAVNIKQFLKELEQQEILAWFSYFGMVVLQ